MLNVNPSLHSSIAHKRGRIAAARSISSSSERETVLAGAGSLLNIIWMRFNGIKVRENRCVKGISYHGSKIYFQSLCKMIDFLFTFDVLNKPSS